MVDEQLVVQDVVAVTDSSPYEVCRDATATLSRIEGLSIAAGWTKAVKDRLAGAEGCTHLTEPLLPRASVAYQAIMPVRRAKNVAAVDNVRPRMIDSCYAYASNREVVMKRRPEFYTGDCDQIA